jgi:hypothetical protein
MIDVKELRIGNLVDFKGGHYKVIEIRLFPELSPGGYWVTLDGFDNPVHVMELNGVDIQDFTLTGSSFDYWGFEWEDEFEAWRYKLDKDEEIIISEGGVLCSTDARCVITKVHHLQNIFQDLTGKEL